LFSRNKSGGLQTAEPGTTAIFKSPLLDANRLHRSYCFLEIALMRAALGIENRRCGANPVLPVLNR
jgi:hypothetical protein